MQQAVGVTLKAFKIVLLGLGMVTLAPEATIISVAQPVIKRDPNRDCRGETTRNQTLFCLSVVVPTSSAKPLDHT